MGKSNAARTGRNAQQDQRADATELDMAERIDLIDVVLSAQHKPTTITGLGQHPLMKVENLL
jgi:hypothetical protein